MPIACFLSVCYIRDSWEETWGKKDEEWAISNDMCARCSDKRSKDAP